MIKVNKISAKETYAIRLSVLRNGIDLPYKFINDFEDSTFHLGAYFNNELMSIATFVKSNYDELLGVQYQLRGMATLKEARGKGLGKLLINEALVFLKSKKVDFLWCNAREAAVPFYKKLGFAIKGEAFLIEKVGFHFKMYIKI